MPKPIITRRSDGEYSTALLPNGIVETCWFPDDRSQPSVVIARSATQTLAAYAADHVITHEERMAAEAAERSITD